MTINLIAGLNKLDISLQLSEATSAGWTDGVEVQTVTVIPTAVYLGESIKIKVYIMYGCDAQLPLPADIHGTVVINGTTLTKDWTISSRNPTLGFEYTPTQIGTFTASALGIAASFTVLPNVPGTYYSPSGGTRMPLCTDILIPDVSPFYLSWCGFTHPGGDLLYSTIRPFLRTPIPPEYSSFPLPHSGFSAVVAQLPNARPIAWTPTDAIVSNWVTYFKAGYTYSLTVMATEYTCQEYWDSKDELANMILAGQRGDGITIPVEWILQYGATCPTCGGTGQVLCTSRLQHCTPGEMVKCSTCGGRGKIAPDLSGGVYGCVKRIDIAEICGGGYCTPQILCPYCNDWLVGTDYKHVRARPWDRLSFVRDFLTHIETEHPNHPLTEPAWF